MLGRVAAFDSARASSPPSGGRYGARSVVMRVLLRSFGALAGDLLGGPVEAGDGLVEQAPGLPRHHLVAAVRRDKTAARRRAGAAAPTRDRPARRDVTVAVGRVEPAGGFDAGGSSCCKRPLAVATSWAITALKPLPCALALDRSMALLELGGPLRLLAEDALGVHQPFGHAGARFAKRTSMPTRSSRCATARGGGWRTSAPSSRPWRSRRHGTWRDSSASTKASRSSTSRSRG